MPDCSYCEESFDDEEGYVQHLRDVHEDELGRIDRRRVEALEQGGEPPLAGVAEALPVDSIPVTRRMVAGALTVVLIAGLVWLVVSLGGSSPSVEPSGIEAEPLPDRGNETLLRGVERFPDEGRNHVDRGTNVDYGTYPPTSGPHYAGTVPAGFYNETPPAGEIVHTLEHGAVVIYYEPAAMTPETRRSLREFAAAHTGTFRSVVVVPHPRADHEAPFVLTAWRHRLRMTEYDPRTVRAFLAEYLGRGPERQVR